MCCACGLCARGALGCTAAAWAAALPAPYAGRSARGGDFDALAEHINDDDALEEVAARLGTTAEALR
eukprot:3201144-Alexandrium_andersonii.AAC.1